jgi:hypothetical protein
MKQNQREITAEMTKGIVLYKKIGLDFHNIDGKIGGSAERSWQASPCVRACVLTNQCLCRRASQTGIHANRPA